MGCQTYASIERMRALDSHAETTAGEIGVPELELFQVGQASREPAIRVQEVENLASRCGCSAVFVDVNLTGPIDDSGTFHSGQPHDVAWTGHIGHDHLVELLSLEARKSVVDGACLIERRDDDGNMHGMLRPTHWRIRDVEDLSRNRA
jgi:hypothetical protein